MTAPVVAFVPDLADRSRVAAAVPGTRFCARVADLVEAVGRSGPPAVVLLDLTRPGAVEAAPGLVAAGSRVVGFGPHVAVALLERARAAGVEAHPRSRFFRYLPLLLAGGPPNSTKGTS